jgi:hypothetical protein
MRSPRLGGDRGIALAVTIFALVIIGALVAGVFYAGRLEQTTGRNTVYLAQASQAADAGADWVLGNWDKATYNSMPVNGQVAFAEQSLGGSVYYTPTLRRLTSKLFVVNSAGSRRDLGGRPLAQQQVAVLARLVNFNFSFPGGLTVIGSASAKGNSAVNGYDAAPAGWTDCPPLGNVAGIVYTDSLDKKTKDVYGVPPTLQNPTLKESDVLGPRSFSEMAAMATKVLTSSSFTGLAPVVTGAPAKCDESVQTNWGAPTNPASPCYNYFPILYHKGNLQITGNGAGQGMLLVEGDLDVAGNVSFYGPIIVMGAIKFTGTSKEDAKFFGAVFSKSLDTSKLAGNASIQYSSCAIQKALDKNAVIAKVSERSWLQYYQ